MKKTVKSLIIAASVAAVAGIGAVSFAAWSGSGKDVVSDSNLSSGTVVAVGFTDESIITGSGKKLMPIDQASITSDTDVYYYMATLKTTGTDFTDYKITVKATAKDGSAIPTGLKVAVLETAPTTGSSASLTGTWTDLGDGQVKDLVTSGIANGQTYTAYIVLSSDNTDYADNAGKQFTVTFELTKPAA